MSFAAVKVALHQSHREKHRPDFSSLIVENFPRFIRARPSRYHLRLVVTKIILLLAIRIWDFPLVFSVGMSCSRGNLTILIFGSKVNC